MNILIWFAILAVLALISSLVTATVTYRYDRFSPIPIGAIWITFILAGAGLYYASSNAGGYISETHFADSFKIDTPTYTYDGDSNKGTFNFYSTDGVQFSFSSKEVLADVPASPTTLDLYTCKYIYGYRWCQLRSEKVIRYLLK